MACRDGRQYFSRGRSGENRANKVDQVNGRDMSDLESLLKISRDPLRTSLRWRDLKLFQIKARAMVHTRGPEKLGLMSNCRSKVLVHDTNFSSKRSLRAWSRIWAPLPGAQHLKGASPVKTNCIWPVETEGNTFLEVVREKIVQQKFANKTVARC